MRGAVPTPVWLIANPRAGGGRSALHASTAFRRLHDAGIACRLVLPSSAAEATQAAQHAVEADARAVVACGGDGTANAVLQAVVGRSVPFGIVAGGSGDDVAASLGMATGKPGTTADWLVRALATHHTKAVDVASARTSDGTTRAYLSVLCTGFDASVNERANRLPRLAGQRYHAAMVRELVTFRPLEYRLDVDAVTRQGTAMMVSVGNGPRFGGGMRVCPTAVLDDGELDVIWVDAMVRRELVRVFPHVYRGTHTRHPKVRMFRTRSVRVDVAGQVAYADGERIGPTPVDVTVLPGAVRVVTT